MGPSRWIRFSLALVLGLSLTIPFWSAPQSRADLPQQGWTAGDEGWVWQNPLPQGNPMYDIVAPDPDHVWLVGDEIMSFDGSAWKRDVGYPANTKAAAALDSSHIWAAGDDIYFYNGTTWAKQAVPSDFYWADDIFALDSTHVWAVGSGLYFFDGSTWSTIPGFGGEAVWASDANHVWVAQHEIFAYHLGYCGYRETIYFFDGATWAEQYSDYSDGVGIVAISGSSASDVGGGWYYSLALRRLDLDAGNLQLFFSGHRGI